MMSLLMEAGADVQPVACDGGTPLHLAALNGHSGALGMLVQAGVRLDATTFDGLAPLLLAAQRGHSAVVIRLIDAGANPNTRMPVGDTPLYRAAWDGYVGAVRVLLRARASPLLGCSNEQPGEMWVPLDAAAAAASGHVAVVLALVQHLGIEGCGGANGGVEALGLAARGRHIDTMAALVDAGIVDTGTALCKAARWGGEPAVKLLLEQQRRKGFDAGVNVNAQDACGATPLIHAAGSGRCSARVVRRLIDARADTAVAFRVSYTPGGNVDFIGTPLALTIRNLREKKVEGKDATKDQLDGLKGIRRLLLQVEAVHAMSWLWHSDAASTASAAGTAVKDRITSASLRANLPILRRRARRRRVGDLVQV